MATLDTRAGEYQRLRSKPSALAQRLGADGQKITFQAQLAPKLKMARISGRALSSNCAILSSVVAEVDLTNPDAVVRATPVAAPFAARTAFPVSIMAMPPARAALARAVAPVNLNKIIPHPTGRLADTYRSGVGERGRHCQEAGGSQNPECIEHLHSPTVLERTMADIFSRPRRILDGSRRPVWC